MGEIQGRCMLGEIGTYTTDELLAMEAAEFTQEAEKIIIKILVREAVRKAVEEFNTNETE